MSVLLIPVFALTALLYSAIGFGGGSTYTALLALAGTDYRLFPILSLTCNILVVTGGTWRFARAGAVPWKRAWPLLIFSVPAAWIGGRLPVGELLFTGLLGLALLVAAILMLLPQYPAATHKPVQSQDSSAKAVFIACVAGTGLGLVAGIVGIGGGIFLAPLLYLIRWDRPRAIAGTASLFILVNSVAGLAGQLERFDAVYTEALMAYWPLFPAVVVGGGVGSWLGVSKLSLNWLRRGTAVLILVVSVRLLWRAATLS